MYGAGRHNHNKVKVDCRIIICAQRRLIVDLILPKSNNLARGHKVGKHHPDGKNVRHTLGVLSIQRENGNGTKIHGKRDIFKETKKIKQQKAKKDADSC